VRATRDARTRQVTVVFSDEEFSDTVRWLEELSPDDGCTQDWLEKHRRFFGNLVPGTPYRPGADDD
jgi:hypothetical protein